MLVQVNLVSEQTLMVEPAPTASVPPSETSRYQVFHIEHSPNVHKIFIPTSFPRPAGYLYYVTEHSSQDHPETALSLMADILSSPEHMGNIHQSQFVGSIAPQDLDRVRVMIEDHSRLLNPSNSVPLLNYATRCEVWVRTTVAMLLNDGVLEAPPPEPVATREHRLPRHHHTAHCIHQRLHSHHPYRRRARQPVDLGRSSSVEDKNENL
ncbi:hypothetical protein FLONG3_10216 [Fusarium longipes]|uniref:Uncharacterized protein n=1 Tax=Fusarium longipes TaxID=694270 RepID=A0A395RR00_9HYPO|nr:hypothetical protein FLONG3_10216 [Fusarium longipes]